MFNLISKLGMGNPSATNVQVIKNLSQYNFAITIKSSSNIWSENLNVGDEKRINAARK